MDAVEYIKTIKRICEAQGDICSRDCPIRNVGGLFCATPSECDADPEEAIRYVEQWSKEHPLVTNGDKVMEIVKDAGVPVTARGSGFDREVPVNTVHIAVSADWWDAEYKGV